MTSKVSLEARFKKRSLGCLIGNLLAALGINIFFTGFFGRPIEVIQTIFFFMKVHFLFLPFMRKLYSLIRSRARGNIKLYYFVCYHGNIASSYIYLIFYTCKQLNLKIHHALIYFLSLTLQVPFKPINKRRKSSIHIVIDVNISCLILLN